jgi:hypothetical protein
MKILKFFKFIFWGYFKIPKGDYCYKIKKIVKDETKVLIKTKDCPYWKLDNEGIGFCDYLKIDSVLLCNQVKECGLKEDNRTYEENMRK